MLIRCGMVFTFAQALCSVVALAARVAVVGAVGEMNMTGAEPVQHVGGAAAVVTLSLGHLQGDRQAIRVDEGIGSWSSARVASAPCTRFEGRPGRRPACHAEGAAAIVVHQSRRPLESQLGYSTRAAEL